MPSRTRGRLNQTDAEWDAAIVASARALGCTTIYTEDLNDGQKYEGMEVVNPFKAFWG